MQFQLAEEGKQAMATVLNWGHRKRPEVVQELAKVYVIKMECLEGGV
jgi:hypothetical protein